jgi:CSLREA domain-containing protein
VTSASDPGNGVCNETCTLREAITAANAAPGDDTITFALPDPAPYKIILASAASGGGPLPPLTDTVTIDASAHYGTIFLDGSAAGPGVDALTVVADDTVIQGLVIVFFSGAGVVVDGADNVRLEGIQPHANGTDGMRIQGGSTGAVVTRNDIEVNKRDGIRILSGSGNNLSGNYIRGNRGLGIDLGGDGVTPNDSGDVDEGANGLQNAPVVSLERATSTTPYSATAALDSTPNTEFLLNLYRGECDPSVYGEGGGELFFTRVTTDDQGQASVTWSPSSSSEQLYFGEGVAATATNLVTSDTSEFSNCLQAGFARASVSITATPDELDIGETVSVVMEANNPGPEPADNVELGIGIPMAVEILSMETSSGGECVRRSDVNIWCQLGDMPVDSTASATLLLRPQEPGYQNVNVVVVGPNISKDPHRAEIHARATLAVGCTVTGTRGNDVLTGTRRDDVICGKGGDDVLVGREGKDVLLGGRGNDILKGGSGFDTASFADADNGVSASLADGVANGVGRDKLVGVDGLIGGFFKDTLTGDADRNVLKGLQSRDQIYGGRGNDSASILDRYVDAFAGGGGLDSAWSDKTGDQLASVESAQTG